MRETEFEKARKWRESLSLSRAQLGVLIGYSSPSIFWYERGQTPERKYKNQKKHDRVIAPEVWLRYKAACAGIDAWLQDKRRFDW